MSGCGAKILRLEVVLENSVVSLVVVVGGSGGRPTGRGDRSEGIALGVGFVTISGGRSCVPFVNIVWSCNPGGQSVQQFVRESGTECTEFALDWHKDVG